MRVGIIGAGQLGMMLGQAAARLDIECVFLDPADAPPAARAGRVIRAGFDDVDALAELARDVDVITYEFENVPVDALRTIDTVDVFPPTAALAAAQDRLHEKQLFASLDIPLPGYRRVELPGRPGCRGDRHRQAAGTEDPPVRLRRQRPGDCPRRHGISLGGTRRSPADRRGLRRLRLRGVRDRKP